MKICSELWADLFVHLTADVVYVYVRFDTNRVKCRRVYPASCVATSWRLAVRILVMNEQLCVAEGLQEHFVRLGT